MDRISPVRVPPVDTGVERLISDADTKILELEGDAITGGGGTDASAIHVDVSGEIAGITAKTTPVAADITVIEDSAASNAKKKVQLGNIKLPHLDTAAVHVDVASEISAVTAKTTPVAADLIIIEDSAAANVKKSVQLGNVKLPHTDSAAIHTDVAGEINGITTKTTPVSADLLVIEDSAAANAKKKITIGSLPAASGPGTDTTAIHTNVSGEIAGITAKSTPVGADLIVIEDSAASNAKKSVALSSNPDVNAFHSGLSGEINGLTLKGTPTGSDLLVIEDAAASNAKKKVTIGSLPFSTGGFPIPFSAPGASAGFTAVGSPTHTDLSTGAIAMEVTSGIIGFVKSYTADAAVTVDVGFCPLLFKNAGTPPRPTVGVILRDSSTSHSCLFGLAGYNGDWFWGAFAYDSSTNFNSTMIAGVSASAYVFNSLGVWVRAQLSGSTWTLYISVDGQYWFSIGTIANSTVKSVVATPDQIGFGMGPIGDNSRSIAGTWFHYNRV